MSFLKDLFNGIDNFCVGFLSELGKNDNNNNTTTNTTTQNKKTYKYKSAFYNPKYDINNNDDYFKEKRYYGEDYRK
jgi:hypothetical protein